MKTDINEIIKAENPLLKVLMKNLKPLAFKFVRINFYTWSESGIEVPDDEVRKKFYENQKSYYDHRTYNLKYRKPQ